MTALEACKRGRVKPLKEGKYLTRVEISKDQDYESSLDGIDRTGRGELSTTLKDSRDMGCGNAEHKRPNSMLILTPSV